MFSSKELFRPLVRGSNRMNAYFFVDYNGTGPIDVGRKLREYFTMYTKYQISTNTVRSLVETSANNLYEEGNWVLYFININIC